MDKEGDGRGVAAEEDIKEKEAMAVDGEEIQAPGTTNDHEDGGDGGDGGDVEAEIPNQNADDDVNAVTMRSLHQSLVAAVVNVAVVDVEPREISPDPPMPDAPAAPEMEVQNVVGDAMKMVDEQQGAALNLDTVDVTQMDPNTAQNVMRLRQFAAAQKEEAKALEINAKYEIAMKNYKLCQVRHREKVMEEDSSNGMIWHSVAHKRLRNMVRDHESVRAAMMEKLFDEWSVGEQQLWSFVDLTGSGVVVLWELYDNVGVEDQAKLKGVLKPICEGIKEKYVPDDIDFFVEKAFNQLCEALQIK